MDSNDVILLVCIFVILYYLVWLFWVVVLGCFGLLFWVVLGCVVGGAV